MTVTPEHAGPDDAGVTLVELLVTMILLSSFSALFLVAISQLNPAMSKQQGISDATTTIRTAFLLLDKQVRYADSINTPGVAYNAQYIEYRWQRATTTSQTNWCTQWRVLPASGLLQQRQWADGAFVASAPWSTVVTGVTGATTSGAGAVFSLPAQVGYQSQQLGFTIAVYRGKPAGRAASSVTLTAANSSRSTAPATPVCAAPTSRTP